MQISYGTTQQVTLYLNNGHFATSEIVNTEGYVDVLVFAKLNTGSSHLGIGVDIYAYGSLTGVHYTGYGNYLNGTVTSGFFNDFGMTSPKVLHGWVNSSGQQLYLGPISIARAFGGILPQRWGLKVYQIKFSGSNSYFTSGEIYYRGITFSSLV